MVLLYRLVDVHCPLDFPFVALCPDPPEQASQTVVDSNYGYARLSSARNGSEPSRHHSLRMYVYIIIYLQYIYIYINTVYMRGLHALVVQHMCVWLCQALSSKCLLKFIKLSLSIG